MILLNCDKLSDWQMEEMFCDWLSLRSFYGFGLEEDFSDLTTIWWFRIFLEEQTEKLMKLVKSTPIRFLD